MAAVGLGPASLIPGLLSVSASPCPGGPGVRCGPTPCPQAQLSGGLQTKCGGSWAPLLPWLVCVCPSVHSCPSLPSCVQASSSRGWVCPWAPVKLQPPSVPFRQSVWPPCLPPALPHALLLRLQIPEGCGRCVLCFAGCCGLSCVSLNRGVCVVTPGACGCDLTWSTGPCRCDWVRVGSPWGMWALVPYDWCPYNRRK